MCVCACVYVRGACVYVCASTRACVSACVFICMSVCDSLLSLRTDVFHQPTADLCDGDVGLAGHAAVRRDVAGQHRPVRHGAGPGVLPQLRRRHEPRQGPHAQDLHSAGWLGPRAIQVCVGVRVGVGGGRAVGRSGAGGGGV